MPGKPTYDELLKKIELLEQQNRDCIMVKEALNHRIALEKLIMEVSARFINLPARAVDKNINRAIKAIGQFLDVDRVYIFKYQSGDNTMDNTHEWCARDVDSHIGRMRGIPLERVPWLVEQINAGKDVHVPMVDALPSEAAVFQAECRHQGIQSILMVPMVFGGHVTGFFGVDAVREPRNWDNEVISLLRITGGILANVMERKHSEEAIHASEEKYRTILETVEDGYWEIDVSGRFTFANPAMCRIADRTYEELIGSDSRADADKETRRRMVSIFTRIYKTGKGEKLSVFEINTPKGNRKFIEISISLVRDHKGAPVGFRGVSRDVTEKVTVQQALRESEEKYRTVMEANPDPVVVSNVKGEIVYFNPAFESVFGWTLAEQKGKILQGFIPKDKRQEFQNFFNIILNGEGFSSFETIRRTKSGARIPVSISGSAYKDTHGNSLGGIVSLRDIQEKKRMEAQLLNAQKFESIGTLAGGIAHDFNNLLMGIQGNVSLALFDLNPHHRLFEIFQNIEKMVKSGSRLTSQLLGYARKGRYEVKPLDINRLIKSISDTFARTRKEIVITHDFSSTLGAVEADEGQMEQALLNILVNAGQAMPKGGKIFIQTGNATHKDIDDTTFKVKPGSYVAIRVTDTGMGMDENIRKHIFELFFTTKEMGRGTGLGLASVYGIIKGHAGYVTVDSELGKGASFNVFLPVSDKAVAETICMAERNIPGKGTILLVDDENIVLNVGSRIIEKLGYQVVKASDGRTALDLYKKYADAVQMVILDIIMPNMSGSEVFDAIRKINPHAKVLLSSGYSIDGQAAGILERGCDGFVQKPFTIAELSGKIHEIMAP